MSATVLTMLLTAACSAEDVDPTQSRTDTVSSTAPSVRILDDCPTLPCHGPLEPGEYRWTFSDPTIDFTIPSPGWTWAYAGRLRAHRRWDPATRSKVCTSPTGSTSCTTRRSPRQDCEESSEPGVGRSVSDLVAWLETAPGLVVSEPTPVTVGGFEGMQLDIEIDPAWKRTCFFSEGPPRRAADLQRGG